MQNIFEESFDFVVKSPFATHATPTEVSELTLMNTMHYVMWQVLFLIVSPKEYLREFIPTRKAFCSVFLGWESKGKGRMLERVPFRALPRNRLVKIMGKIFFFFVKD